MVEQDGTPRAPTPTDLLTQEIKTPVSESPEVHDRTINDLFLMDAEEIAEEDITRMISYMRGQRELWERAEAEASKTKGARVKKSSTTSVANTGQVRLDSLNLDIDLGDLAGD